LNQVLTQNADPKITWKIGVNHRTDRLVTVENFGLQKSIRNEMVNKEFLKLIKQGPLVSNE